MKKRVLVIMQVLGLCLLTGCSVGVLQKKESEVKVESFNDIQKREQIKELNIIPTVLPLYDYLSPRIARMENTSDSQFMDRRVYYDANNIVVCEINHNLSSNRYTLRFYDDADNLFYISDVQNQYYDPMEQTIYLRADKNYGVSAVENIEERWVFDIDDDGVPNGWGNSDNSYEGSIRHIDMNSEFEYQNNEYEIIYDIGNSQFMTNYPCRLANVNNKYTLNDKRVITLLNKDVSIGDYQYNITSSFDESGKVEYIQLSGYNYEANLPIKFTDGVILSSSYDTISKNILDYIPSKDFYDLDQYRVFYNEKNVVRAIASPDYAWFFEYDGKGKLAKTYDIYNDTPCFKDEAYIESDSFALSKDMVNQCMPREGEPLYFKRDVIYDEETKTSKATMKLAINDNDYVDVLNGQMFDEIEVIRADNKIVSFCSRNDGVLRGLNYNPSTGEEIKLTDFVINYEGLKQYVASRYHADLDINNLNWYVDRSNLYLIFNDVIYKIVAEDIQNYLYLNNNYGQYLYIQKNKTYTISNKDQEKIDIDIDGDGQIETVYVTYDEDQNGENSNVCLNVLKAGKLIQYPFELDSIQYLEKVYIISMANGKNYVYLNNSHYNDYAEYDAFSFDANAGLQYFFSASTSATDFIDLKAEGFWKNDYEYLLGSHNTVKWTTIGDDGKFIYHTNSKMRDEVEFTLLMDLVVSVEDFDGIHNVTIPKGEKVRLKEIINNNTALLELLNDEYEFKEFRMKLTGNNDGDGYYYMGIPETDVFDNITYAG